MKYRFLFACLVIVFYLLRLQSVVKSFPKIPDGTVVKYVGKVTKQPYLKTSYQIVPMQDITIFTDRFPGYFYGERLEVIGKTKREVIGTLESKIVLYWPQITRLQTRSGFINQTGIVASLLRFRGHIEDHLNGLIPEPESSLLTGILLGSHNQLPDYLSQQLRLTGTIHVVVASGFNVALVAGGLVALLTVFVKRRPAVILSILGILAYTVMAGAEPPVTRAAIMGIILCLAQVFGREYQATRALLLTAVVILLLSPLMLFDIGFQLSFLATLGLLAVAPLFKGKIFKFPLLGAGLSTTLAAQSTTLPILLLNFGQTNVLSPIINALVLPIIPLTMVFGAMTAFLSFIFAPLAKLMGMITYVFLHYFVLVVNFFGQFDFPVVDIKFSLVLVAIYYFLLLFIIGKRRKVD